MPPPKIVGSGYSLVVDTYPGHGDSRSGSGSAPSDGDGAVVAGGVNLDSRHTARQPPSTAEASERGRKRADEDSIIINNSNNSNNSSNNIDNNSNGADSSNKAEKRATHAGEPATASRDHGGPKRRKSSRPSKESGGRDRRKRRGRRGKRGSPAHSNYTESSTEMTRREIEALRSKHSVGSLPSVVGSAKGGCHGSTLEPGRAATEATSPIVSPCVTTPVMTSRTIVATAAAVGEDGDGDGDGDGDVDAETLAAVRRGSSTPPPPIVVTEATASLPHLTLMRGEATTMTSPSSPPGSASNSSNSSHSSNSSSAGSSPSTPTDSNASVSGVQSTTDADEGSISGGGDGRGSSPDGNTAESGNEGVGGVAGAGKLGIPSSRSFGSAMYKMTGATAGEGGDQGNGAAATFKMVKSKSFNSLAARPAVSSLPRAEEIAAMTTLRRRDVVLPAELRGAQRLKARRLSSIAPIPPPSVLMGGGTARLIADESGYSTGMDGSPVVGPRGRRKSNTGKTGGFGSSGSENDGENDDDDDDDDGDNHRDSDQGNGNDRRVSGGTDAIDSPLRFKERTEEKEGGNAAQFWNHRRALRARLVPAADRIFLLDLACVACVVGSLESGYHGRSGAATFFRTVLLLLSVCATVMLWRYHAIMHALAGAEGRARGRFAQLGSPHFRSFLVDAFLHLAMVPPFVEFTITAGSLSVAIAEGGPERFTVRGDALNVLVFARMYVAARVVELRSRFNSSGAHFVKALGNVESSFEFTVKSLARLRPFTLLLCCYAPLVVALGYGLYVVERDSHSSPLSPLDSLWLLSATMLTIGYGDIFPENAFGRALCVVAAVSGVIGNAFLFAFVTEKLRLATDEERVVNLLQRDNAKRAYRDAAGRAIYRAMQLSRHRRQYGSLWSLVIASAEQRHSLGLYRDLRELRTTRKTMAAQLAKVGKDTLLEEIRINLRTLNEKAQEVIDGLERVETEAIARFRNLWKGIEKREAGYVREGGDVEFPPLTMRSRAQGPTKRARSATVHGYQPPPQPQLSQANLLSGTTTYATSNSDGRRSSVASSTCTSTTMTEARAVEVQAAQAIAAARAAAEKRLDTVRKRVLRKIEQERAALPELVRLSVLRAIEKVQAGGKAESTTKK